MRRNAGGFHFEAPGRIYVTDEKVKVATVTILEMVGVSEELRNLSKRRRMG